MTDRVVVKGEDLLIFNNARVERTGDGAVRSSAGNAGYVLYGPYAQVFAGVYEVELDIVVDGEVSPDDFWDVTDGRREVPFPLIGEPRALVYVDATRTFEVRLHAGLCAFTLTSAAWRPVLLDDQPLDAQDAEAAVQLALRSRLSLSACEYLADRIERIGRPDLAAALRNGGMEAESRRDHPAVALLRAMQAPGATEAADDRFAGVGDASIGMALDQRPITVLDAQKGFSRQDRLLLARLGYKAAAFENLLGHRSKGEPVRAAQSIDRDGVMHGARGAPEFIRRLLHMDFSFQTKLLRDGVAEAFCPVSGRLVQSRHGFCQSMTDMPYTFYRFESEQTFYLCTGSWHAGRLFVYLPQSDLIVLLCHPWYYSASPTELSRKLVLNQARNRRHLAAFLANPTSPALVTGIMNVGHMFWNEAGGLQFLVDNGRAGDAHALVHIGRTILDAKATFPELGQGEHYSALDETSAFDLCLSRGFLPVRLADLAVSPALTERLRQASHRHAKTSAHSALGEHTGPLVWLNLRAHNKIWIEQASGYAEILNALKARYGSVCAILDGQPDCRAMADDLARRCDPDIRIFDGLEVGIFESLDWAFASDVCIVTLGAGLALVNWAASRPSVAHCETSHMDQLEWWRFAHAGAAQTLAPRWEDVTDLGEGAYCNYSLDWRILFDLATRILDETWTPIGPPA